MSPATRAWFVGTLAALGLSLSCSATAVGEPSEGAPPSPPAIPCAQPAGLAPLLAPGHVLLLGEMHGTVESPAFTTAVVCAVLEHGLEIVVGLEIPYPEQSLFDAFLASDGSAAAEQSLLASEHWTRTYQDGRSSEAMLGLVRDLRERLAGGAPLRLVLFDDQVPDRDAAMARRLATATERVPHAFVVALTGNLHARLTPGSPWNESFEPMGMFLRSLLPGRPVMSLDVSHAGGRAWICTSGDAADCGERSLQGDELLGDELRGDEPLVPGVHLAPGESPHYSGRYAVGELHASLPAVRPPSP